MSALLARIARALTHHWKRSLAAAIVVIALLGAAAGAGGRAADDFAIPGTETQQALDLFKAHSPAFAGADATVVFSTEDGSLSDGDRRAAIEQAIGEIRRLDHVEAVSDPFAAGGALSRDGRIANVSVRYDVEATDIETDDGEALEDAARSAEGSGVDVSMRGIVVDLAQEQEAPIGELIGVAIAIVLLTLLFRSARGDGGHAARCAARRGDRPDRADGALAKPLGLPEFASTIAVMLGLGAGIDYALLIIGRFREQVAAGDSVRDASAKALATSGSSVVAAGLIVMVAIAGLLVIGIPMIGKMGIGAAIGIAAVVVSAITILPIMRSARFAEPAETEEARARRSRRRPFSALGRARHRASLGSRSPPASRVLLVFAIPVTQMRLGQPDDGNKPESRTQRIAYDLLSDGFGPGSNGPFLLAVDIPRGDAQTTSAADESWSRRSAGCPASRRSLRRRPAQDGEMATIVAIPTTAPQDSKTSDLLEQLRDDAIPAAVARHAAEGLRRRQHRRLRGLLVQGRQPACRCSSRS